MSADCLEIGLGPILEDVDWLATELYCTCPRVGTMFHAVSSPMLFVNKKSFQTSMSTRHILGDQAAMGKRRIRCSFRGLPIGVFSDIAVHGLAPLESLVAHGFPLRLTWEIPEPKSPDALLRLHNRVRPTYGLRISTVYRR